MSIFPLVLSDNLNTALGAIRVLGLELIEDELKPHLNTVLIHVKERSEFISQSVAAFRGASDLLMPFEL